MEREHKVAESHRFAPMSLGDTACHTSGSAVQVLYDIEDRLGRTSGNDQEQIQQLGKSLGGVVRRLKETLELLKAGCEYSSCNSTTYRGIKRYNCY